MLSAKGPAGTKAVFPTPVEMHNTRRREALWGAFAGHPRNGDPMTNLQRRLVRSLTLVLIAASLGACHFHGHHGCGGDWGPRYYAPVRHCR